MTVGADTYVSDLITRAGGINVWADRTDRYPTIELEDLRARSPELVLLPDEPYRFREKDRLALQAILASEPSSAKPCHRHTHSAAGVDTLC